MGGSHQTEYVWLPRKEHNKDASKEKAEQSYHRAESSEEIGQSREAGHEAEYAWVPREKHHQGLTASCRSGALHWLFYEMCIVYGPPIEMANLSGRRTVSVHVHCTE